MKRCSKCIMPDTKPGITFVDGVCNACLNAAINDQTDWGKRWNILRDEVWENPICNEKYNCVIPVSGGKDSTFLAIKATALGLNPLCVNVAPCEPTARGERNLRNLSKLGFDIFRFLPNQRIMPTLVKRSLIEDGDPCTSHEFMLYSVPVRMAMKFKIPFIFWAENPQFEYGNLGEVRTASEQKNIAGLWGRSAEHWRSEGIGAADLIPFQHPAKEEIEAAGVEAFYMSDYVRWDSRKTAQLAVEYGLEVRPREELLGTGGYWNFEQLDDETPVIGHYFKYLKFGYGRATDQACRDIRLGYISRDEGLELAQKYDGNIDFDYISRFCRYINITIKEFDEICEKWRKK